jgi:hypothetical protein
VATINSYEAGTSVQCNGVFSTAVVTTASFTAGATYTSLSVSPLEAAIADGDSLTIGSGPSQQVVTANGTALVGATSITVHSFSANNSFPIATPVSYLVDPAVVTFKWQPGFRATESGPLTYSPGGSGLGVIIRVSKGIYFVQLDTTGSLSTQWTYQWVAPAGVGQAAGSNVFNVTAVPL